MRNTFVKAIALGSLICMATACSAKPETGNTIAKAVATSQDAVAKATSNAKNKAALETVDEAYQAMRAVRAARLAIFDGSVPVAKDFLNDAVKNMDKAKMETKNLKIKTSKADINDQLVPFDMAVQVGEEYVASPVKDEKIKDANRHLAKGEHKKAMEVLRLADINVLTTAALLPINSAITGVKDAKRLIDEGKYYAANMALKAVEDSVVVEAYDVDGLPAAKPEKKS